MPAPWSAAGMDGASGPHPRRPQGPPIGLGHPPGTNTRWCPDGQGPGVGTQVPQDTEVPIRTTTSLSSPPPRAPRPPSRRGAPG